MKAVILCAGKGERLQPLTYQMPKPMIPIAGKPLLEYIVKLCKKHGIDQIGINTSYLPGQIREYFGDGSKLGVSLKYSFEEELLGTAGALNNFRQFLDEPFFVLHGDNIADVNLTAMRENHARKAAAVSMLVYRPTEIDEKMGPGYVLLDAKGNVNRIIEKPTANERAQLDREVPAENRAINAGIYYLDHLVLDFIPDGVSDFPRDIFPNLLMMHNTIAAHHVDGYYKEVGQMNRYLAAKEEIESGAVTLNL